jgi:putative transposase
MSKGDFYRGKPPRLANVFAKQTPPLYFVTATSWQRQTFLAQASVHETFIRHAKQIEMRGIAIGRYVIMPDHIHLFVRIGNELSLSTMMRLLKQDITRALRVRSPDLRVWQPGFFDHLLRSDESYARKWDYVRMNPVRKNLVVLSEEWPYQGEVVRIDRA